MTKPAKWVRPKTGQTWEITIAYPPSHIYLLTKVGRDWTRYLDLETGQQGDILTLKFLWCKARRIG